MRPCGILSGFLLVLLCVYFVCAATKDEAPPKKKRRGCRCLKKYMNEVNSIVEQKLKKFEEKYFISALPGAPTGSERIMSMADRRFVKLTADVQESKDALVKLNLSLRNMKDQMKSQKRDVMDLTSNLDQLEGIVTNLTSVVHRIEVMQPGSGDSLGQSSDVDLSTRPPGYPKVTFGKTNSSLSESVKEEGSTVREVSFGNQILDAVLGKVSVYLGL
ncbi:hypothetical protein LOTGIDRAFT_152797 [Lottia gigantea]|uniref:Uncharacterized protein n=1 Tax=Lottia gigantea TaxID=225164 RepID=V4AS61_LOTGI|nr:hypothetical protein LOTGIDRAFT_152797 [Lottia gigantea]ESO97705.1 hypothetical protein LOTGIDRAFT_152797 [Lottia gigantea]